LALPSAALAQGAGDDQYVDPLAGLTDSGGGASPNKQKKSSGGSSNDYSSAAEATEIATEVTEATETEEAKSKPKAGGRSAVKRPALDVNALSGIGPLVAVPVEHVTLVVGGIANERS
jgi:hypothetical protein